ncbi:MAG TPA: hypothetical protein VFE60_13950 [Roseiarcus sp.]|jgi:hypothetical protein|nr:hypothetical protein [Roseiarcus sp.]
MSRRDVIVPASASDGWGDAAREATQRVILGLMLLFADWKWTTGREHTPVPEGILLAALSTAAGWVRWAAGKPVEYVMREPGGQLADRDTLGHTDQAHWEVGPSGDKQDPWRSSRFVYLVDPQSAEVYTFTTSSIGGIGAVSDLAEKIGRRRAVHPGATPLVQLAAAEMPTRFGRKSRPVFKVVDWEIGAAGKEATPATRRLTSEEVREADRKSFDAEFDDEVPFGD